MKEKSYETNEIRVNVEAEKNPRKEKDTRAETEKDKKPSNKSPKRPDIVVSPSSAHVVLEKKKPQGAFEDFFEEGKEVSLVEDALCPQ